MPGIHPKNYGSVPKPVPHTRTNLIKISCFPSMLGSLAFPLPLLWTLAHVFRVLLCIALNSILSCDTKLVSVPLKEERRFVLQDNLLFLPYFSYFCDPVAFHNFRWVPTFRSATKCGQWKMVSVSAWTVYFGLDMWILYIYMYMYVYIY